MNGRENMFYIKAASMFPFLSSLMESEPLSNSSPQLQSYLYLYLHVTAQAVPLFWFLFRPLEYFTSDK